MCPFHLNFKLTDVKFFSVLSYYVYQFITKNIIKGTDKQPDEELIGEVWKGFKHRNFSPWGTGVHHLPNTWMHSPTWKLLHIFHVGGFLLQSSFSLLVLVIHVFSFCLILTARVLSILLIFIKSQLLAILIFSIVNSFIISLTSILLTFFWFCSFSSFYKRKLKSLIFRLYSTLIHPLKAINFPISSFFLDISLWLSKIFLNIYSNSIYILIFIVVSYLTYNLFRRVLLDFQCLSFPSYLLLFMSSVVPLW